MSTDQPWRILLAVLCVLLVVLTGFVQVAHTHADGANHADCGLCVAAHIGVQVTHTPAEAPPVAVTTPVEVAPTVILLPTLSPFALFTRPPPAASLAA